MIENPLWNRQEIIDYTVGTVNSNTSQTFDIDISSNDYICVGYSFRGASAHNYVFISASTISQLNWAGKSVQLTKVTGKDYNGAVLHFYVVKR